MSNLINKFLQLQESKHPNIFEASKKLDKVGKEDADIDNDGDKDKSDEYLHNRRKAIGLSVKRMASEVMNKTKKPMREEAPSNRSVEMDNKPVRKPSDTDVTTSIAKKEKDALTNKVKEVQNEEIEGLDEISDSKKRDYLDKAISSHFKMFTSPADKSMLDKKGRLKKSYVNSPEYAKKGEKLEKRRAVIQKVAKQVTGKKHYSDNDADSNAIVHGQNFKYSKNQNEEIEVEDLFSDAEIEHIETILGEEAPKRRGRPPKEGSAAWNKQNTTNAEVGDGPVHSGRDPRKHIQVSAGEAAGGREVEFTHNNGEKTTINPAMGRKIQQHLYSLKPAARQDAVNAIHDSPKGLKGI